MKTKTKASRSSRISPKTTSTPRENDSSDQARHEKQMKFAARIPTTGGAIQPFVPDPNAVFTIETTAHILDVPRRTILVYYKHGLVSPATDPEDGGYCFTGETIGTMRRIESLRTICGDDLPGIKLILDLMNEVERLHSELRFLRA